MNAGQDKKLQNLRDYKSWQNITNSAAKKFEVVCRMAIIIEEEVFRRGERTMWERE